MNGENHRSVMDRKVLVSNDRFFASDNGPKSARRKSTKKTGLY